MVVLRKRQWQKVLGECIGHSRFYSSKINLRNLRPVILERIENRAKEYPIPHLVPLSEAVLGARARLIHGISTLLKAFPVVTCKFCPEVYVGEKGHLIRTCCGPSRTGKKFLHRWVSGGLSDILVQVETFHRKKSSQDVIKHRQKFVSERVPAVLELCRQLGVRPSDETLYSYSLDPDSLFGDVKYLSPDDLRYIAEETFEAWERVRTGVQRLLHEYPVKVCTYCSEVHVGPYRQSARLCGVYNYENTSGAHLWKKANVDDLLPENLVWRRRSFDPPLLLNKCKGYYGHLPAVVELCVQAGLVPPSKYFCMMKVMGLAGPVIPP